MKSKLYNILRILFVVTGLGCVASAIWIGYRYVHTDARFTLNLVTVKDLKRVEVEDVLNRIHLKTGKDTNIFAVDLEDIRTRVEEIEWIHHVTVQRVLPDQIIIRVVEREPIGLTRIRGRIQEFDSEAVILEPDNSPLPKLPVLLELSERDTESNLKKVEMYNKVIADLGADGISQVLVNASGEVSIVRDDDPLIVKLGVADFKERWSRYLALKSMISSDYKDVVRVDLRFRNKVILSTQDEDDGKVIWDGKKKSL
jgi:cell division septal protein FtsQ